MARRGASHSFNKRQKERKRKEKAERKSERRLLRKQPGATDAEPGTSEGLETSAVDVDGNGHSDRDNHVDGEGHVDVDTERAEVFEANSQPEDAPSSRTRE